MSKKTYISPAGGKYEGDFKDGQRHGKGTYIYPSGSKYVGEYKDDKKHGKGTFTFPDGSVYVGEFREAKEWNVIGYDQNGNEKIKWVNGKIEQ